MIYIFCFLFVIFAHFPPTNQFFKKAFLRALLDQAQSLTQLFPQGPAEYISSCIPQQHHRGVGACDTVVCCYFFAQNVKINGLLVALY